MIRVVVVSLHEYGRAVLAAVKSSAPHDVRLVGLITASPDLGRQLVGARFADLKPLVTEDASILLVDDLTLGELSKAPQSADLQADVVLVAGWPRLIAPNALDWLQKSCGLVIGFHPTYLPQGRGVDPIAWCVWDRPDSAGVSAFVISPEADSGPVVVQRAMAFTPGRSASVLFALAARSHFVVARDVLQLLVEDNLAPVEQNESDATYWTRMASDNRIVMPDDPPELAILKVKTFAAPYDWARLGAPDGLRILGEIRGRLVVEENNLKSTLLRYNVGLMGDSIMDDRLSMTEPEGQVDRRYAGAVIDDGQGCLYLQQRDDKPDIVNPGMVTLFGGVVEDGEDDDAGLRRELLEELGLRDITGVKFLGFVDKIERDASTTRCAIYSVSVQGIADAEVMEGKGFAVGTVDQLLALPAVSLVARVALESI